MVVVVVVVVVVDVDVVVVVILVFIKDGNRRTTQNRQGERQFQSLRERHRQETDRDR